MEFTVSVWSWIPPDNGVPGTWYEECRCRNNEDALSVKVAMGARHPKTHYAHGARPDKQPIENGGAT